MTNTSFASNFEDDFEGGAITPASLAKAVAATTLQNAAHVERCPKCRGTGHFVSYSGRQLGPCYACKGKGSHTYKTSAADRAQSRAKAADRKVQAATTALQQFAAQHPAEAAWIEAERSSFEFAQAMHDAIQKFGSLTDNQLAACSRAVARKAEREAQRQAAQVARLEAAPVVSMAKLMGAFASAASNGLKSPKLRVAGLVISPAKAASTNAGFLYVKAGETYLGKISPGGRFLRGRDCSDADEAQLLAVAADPLAAAVAYGRETGTCSCCGLELTNKLSIELGIGPICRGKWGLG